MGSLAAAGTPLFPHQEESGQWARQAVSELSEKGLLEGYPGGHYGGNRAVTRFELALLVARCWERWQAHGQGWASREDREKLERLGRELAPELEALGIRLSSLEQRVEELDRRLDELNRITFYGEFQTRATAQAFSNRGSGQSDPLAPVLNYSGLVGSLGGAGNDVGIGPAANVDFDPRFFGVMPVVDLRSATPLVDGVGFTSRLMLGLRSLLDPEQDLTAGLELAAYSAQGNSVVDAYAGVSAPYLNNAFSGQGVGNSNVPLSRMTLDHFWVRHGLSSTTLTVGSFRTGNFDPLVYRPQPNPNLWGPRWLNNYGLHLKGDRVDLGEDLVLNYEAFSTRLADGNEGLSGSGYFTHGEGLSAGLEWDDHRAHFRVNLMRAANEALDGDPAGSGRIGKANQQTATPWVNPAGFYAGQLPALAGTGAGGASDGRPIPSLSGLDGFSGRPGVANFGNLGPQDQTILGFSAGYHFEGWLRPYLFGEWAGSHYRPQKNSSYVARGQAWRVGLQMSLPIALREALAEGLEATRDDYLGLDLEAQALGVDARYDPFVLQVPRLVGANSIYRTPDVNSPTYLYPLHDTATYPHNRQGFRLRADWEYGPAAHLEVGYGNLRQTTPSLPDVHFSAGSLGVGIPDSLVVGFSPGFVDPVFGGLAVQTFAPQGSNAVGRPLENPRGSLQNWTVAWNQQWPLDEEGTRHWGLRMQWGSYHFQRSSQLSSLLAGPSGLLGENINRVDLRYAYAEGEWSHDWSEALSTRLGYFQAKFRGHSDPFGVYGAYALQAGSSAFDSLDLTQHQPFLAVDWRVDDNITVDADFRWLETVDRVPASVFPTPVQSGLNLSFPAQISAHPFSWSGYRLSTGMTVRF